MDKKYEFEGISQYRFPLCNELFGVKLSLTMDNGKDYTVAFTDDDKVFWQADNEEQHEDHYDCLKVEDELYFLNLEVSKAESHTGLTLALDLREQLVTCVKAAMEGKTGNSARFTKTEIITGAIKNDDGTATSRRHHYTADLVGKAICWTYDPYFSIIHTYPTERYEKPILVYYHDDRNENIIKAMEDPETVLPWPDISASPVDWLKIREGIYLLNIIEISHPEMLEEPKRNSLTFVFDLKRMHNYGRAFGFTEGDHLPENYVFTAFGKFVPMEELSEKDALPNTID